MLREVVEPTIVLPESRSGLHDVADELGVLLTEAQNVNAVALYPWLMFPVVPVVVTVLAFNFLGDGLRDAADPCKAD